MYQGNQPINYTRHARLRISERNISMRSVAHAVFYGVSVPGRSNKMVIEDQTTNTCVVAVSLGDFAWLIITAYQLDPADQECTRSYLEEKNYDNAS